MNFRQRVIPWIATALGPHGPGAGLISRVLGSYVAIALVAFALSAAWARGDEAPSSAWGKVAAGAKQLVRNPFRRADKPNPVPNEGAVPADEPKPRAQLKAPRSPVKQATFLAGKPRQASRTLSEYMAQERP